MLKVFTLPDICFYPKPTENVMKYRILDRVVR